MDSHHTILSSHDMFLLSIVIRKKEEEARAWSQISHDHITALIYRRATYEKCGISVPGRWFIMNRIVTDL